MKDYLILHIDLEFIAGLIHTSNGRSFPIKNGNEELLWLYFFNDPHRNKVTFGKDNKKHHNNLELNYYGDYFNQITEKNSGFTVRGAQRPLIEIIENSGLIGLLKSKYKEITLDVSDNIPTLITFSLSISNSAKQLLVEFLTSRNFSIESYTIPLAELISFYYWKESKIIINNSKSVLFLKATNTTLHLMKLNFTDGYFLKDEPTAMVYKGKGYDPRKKSIVKLVVNEVNNSTGVLSSQEDIEKECERFESIADEWLKRIDAICGNRPVNITSINLSPAPSLRRDVLVRREDIESDTGFYIKELIDIYNAFENDHIKEKGSIASVILFGDCFNNRLIRKKFENQVDKDKLIITTTNKLLEILSVYPSIDIRRYSDAEERIKALAQSESEQKAQLIAMENKRKAEDEEKSRKIEESNKIANNKRIANDLLKKAIALDSENKLLDAIANIEHARELDPNNEEILLLYNKLREKKIELDITTRQFKKLFSEGEKHVSAGEYNEAIIKFELAKSIIDSPEIRNTIIELKLKIKEEANNKKKVIQFIDLANQYFIEKKLSESKSAVESALRYDNTNEGALQLLKDVNEAIKKQENEFKALKEKADDFYKKNNLIEATSNYKAALEFFPKDLYCLNQLKEISRLTESLDKKKNEFEKIIKDADQLFEEKQWAIALQEYEKARIIFPDDKYVNNQIDKLKFNQLETQREFSKKLRTAIGYFNSKEYFKAKEMFEELIKFQPNNSQIKEKLRLIKIKLSFGIDETEDKKPEKDDHTPEDWDFGRTSTKIISKHEPKQNNNDDFLKNPKISPDKDVGKNTPDKKKFDF